MLIKPILLRGASMKKIFILSISLLFVGLASATDCGTASCYDYCESSYVTVDGDSCDQSWNIQDNCYEAFGYCRDESGGNPCEGETTSCYDYCESSYVTVHGDTCDTSWDYSRNCYQAVGSCSN